MAPVRKTIVLTLLQSRSQISSFYFLICVFILHNFSGCVGCVSTTTARTLTPSSEPEALEEPCQKHAHRPVPNPGDHPSRLHSHNGVISNTLHKRDRTVCDLWGLAVSLAPFPRDLLELTRVSGARSFSALGGSTPHWRRPPKLMPRAGFSEESATNASSRFSCEQKTSLLWDRCPRVPLLGHTVTVCPALAETARFAE